MELCPCGSELDYSKCCEPIIKGKAVASGPESTMRARYSAYVTGDVAFIESSTHPTQLKDFNLEEVKIWSESSEWEGLSVLGHKMVEDKKGEVEFVARYSYQGKSFAHHENATFVKEGDRWFFYDGKIINDTIKRETPKVGRNDNCPCGSGKKFKKCCGK